MPNTFWRGLRSVTRRRMHLWQALILASGAATLTWVLLWWLAKSHGSVYLTGPYHVPLVVEQFAGGVALIGSVAVAIELFRGSQPTWGGISLGAAAVLLATSVIITFLWRAGTVPGENESIGGGFGLLFGPFILAGLLCACLGVERANGGVQSRFAWWTALALSTGPIGVAAVVLFL